MGTVEGRVRAEIGRRIVLSFAVARDPLVALVLQTAAHASSGGRLKRFSVAPFQYCMKIEPNTRQNICHSLGQNQYHGQKPPHAPTPLTISPENDGALTQIKPVAAPRDKHFSSLARRERRELNAELQLGLRPSQPSVTSELSNACY